MRHDDLDDLFSAARACAPAPSAALLARVLADAEAARPRPAAAPLRAAPARPAPRRGPWSALAAALGGGGGIAGLATAAGAGLWLGLVQPVPLAGLTPVPAAVVLDTVELIPSLDLLAAE